MCADRRWAAAVRKARAALGEFSIEGVRTNIGFLRELLSDGQLQSGWVTTGFRRREASQLGRGSVVAPAATSVSRRSSSIRVRKCCARNWPAPWSKWRPEGGVRCRRPTGRPRGDEDAACARRAGRAANGPEPGDAGPGRRNRRPVAGLHPCRGRRRWRIVRGRGRSRPAARRPRRGAQPALAHPRRGSPGPRCQAAQRRVAAPRGRTSPTWSTPTASSSTARWRLPRSAAGARKTT